MLTYWTGVFIFGGGGGGGCKEELEIVDLILLFLRWFIDPLVQVKTAAHRREREVCEESAVLETRRKSWRATKSFQSKICIM